MSAVAEKTEYTPADLLAMPDGKSYEVVDGNLVERNVSALSSLVSLAVGSILRNFCETHRSGWVFDSDCGYQCFPGSPKTVRKPDISFVRKDRLSLEQLYQTGFFKIPPDLAVEMISPNDLAYEVAQKIEQYLKAGTRLVWEVNPLAHTVLVHRSDRTISGLRANDELDGEDVLPGFRCRVGELSRPSRCRSRAHPTWDKPKRPGPSQCASSHPRLPRPTCARRGGCRGIGPSQCGRWAGGSRTWCCGSRSRAGRRSC